MRGAPKVLIVIGTKYKRGLSLTRDIDSTSKLLANAKQATVTKQTPKQERKIDAQQSNVHVDDLHHHLLFMLYVL